MIKAEVITPSGIVFKDDVDMVVAPSIDGEIGMMQKHTPLLANLKKGEVRLKKGDSIKKFNIEDGFLEAMPDKVIILTTSSTK